MQQQPTVSHRLAALEREVGALLFERLGTGLALTSAGEASLPYAAQLPALAGEALHAARRGPSRRPPAPGLRRNAGDLPAARAPARAAHAPSRAGGAPDRRPRRPCAGRSRAPPQS